MLPVCAAQVHPAQAIYLFPLAFPKSASAQTAPQARRHLQLQPGRVLLQVRRGQWRVPRRRRVSVRMCVGGTAPAALPLDLALPGGRWGRPFVLFSTWHTCTGNAIFEVFLRPGLVGGWGWGGGRGVSLSLSDCGKDCVYLRNNPCMVQTEFASLPTFDCHRVLQISCIRTSPNEVQLSSLGPLL